MKHALPLFVAGIMAIAAPSAHGETEIHAEHHAHANHVAVFAGAVGAHEEVGAAVGVDVERRRGRVGVALAVDVARIHDANQVLVIPAVVMHPWGGVKLLCGVGWEHAHGHDAVVYRAGGGYDVHLGSWSVGPAFAVDRASGATAVVGGVSIGAGF